MRVLFLEGSASANWREIDEPELDDGGALVRPLAVAFCDADRAAVTGELPIPTPYPLGHEFVAEVIETTEGVDVSPGQHVVVPFQISCGHCVPCSEGRTGNCASVRPLSMYGFGDLGGPWGGAFADVVHVPFAEHMLVPLAEGVPATVAANASDNLADAWRAVVPASQQRPGASVLVVGGGAPSIGLWAAELATAVGAEAVTYVDDDPARLQLASDVGAQPVEGPAPKRLEHHPITVDASGSPDGLAACLRSTEPDGVCTSVSIYFEDPHIPMLEMYSKNVTLVTGRPHSRAMLEQMLEALGEGVIDPLRIADVVGWEHAATALVTNPTPKIVVQRDTA